MKIVLEKLRRRESEFEDWYAAYAYSHNRIHKADAEELVDIKDWYLDLAKYIRDEFSANGVDPKILKRYTVLGKEIYYYLDYYFDGRIVA